MSKGDYMRKDHMILQHADATKTAEEIAKEVNSTPVYVRLVLKNVPRSYKRFIYDWKQDIPFEEKTDKEIARIMKCSTSTVRMRKDIKRKFVVTFLRSLIPSVKNIKNKTVKEICKEIGLSESSVRAYCQRNNITIKKRKYERRAT